jgi:formylglycine-generating enzyme required for sulfatase activity
MLLIPKGGDLPAFFLDDREVSAGDYAKCVADGLCQSAQGQAAASPDLPATGVTREMAQIFCRWRGKSRLPTQAEWTRAAGDDGRKWPAGAKPAADCCNLNGAAPVAVTATNGDVSQNGVHGMTGNVTEWVAKKPGDDKDITMGGMYVDDLDAAKLDQPHPWDTGSWQAFIGFRCAADAPP